MVSLLGFGSLLLATAIPYTVAQNETAVAANLEHFWSYGRSPPVYPSPQMTGADGWEDAYNFAKNMVSKMTNDEKNNITYGYTSTTNGCSGNIPANTRLGFPGICLQDSGNGVRGTDGVNGFPPGLHIGATWNRDIALQRAQHIGAEFKRKGANMALGPVVGPLGRVARGGRNWEGFSNDPYLAGSLVSQTITGMQESIIACVKHFVGYEQETNRIPPALVPGALNMSVSSNMDDRTLHELYAWPFQDAVHAGAGAVMCSYNQLNGSSGCQNSKTLNGLLKGEWKFQGPVVSDWIAQQSGLASARAGLDVSMPSSTYWENGNLSLMVSNGSLPQDRLDDMATRIIATWYKFARIENPGFGMPVSVAAPHELVDARDPSSADVIYQGAVEGHVLVKNVNNALPLRKPRLLSLFGYDGIAYSQNNYANDGLNFWTLGLENTLVIPGLGPWNATYYLNTFLSGEPWNTPVPAIAINGTMITGGGSGSITPAYVDAPFNALQRQAQADGTWLSWNFFSQDPLVNGASDACIVFINAIASEGWDRPNLADDYSDTLVENVTSQCSNTHVVIHHAGIRLVDRWIDNPNVTAVIYAHLPGQDSGQALVDIIYGKTSPSGRLPYTVAKQASDYGQLLAPTVPDNTTEWHTQSNFTEGLYIDYKHFIAQNITPRYEFGFGLTYTTFEYSDLQITKSHARRSTSSTNSTDSELWQTVATVSCDVKNTGQAAAAEVAQLYLNIPGGPAKVLRGFDKLYLQPGESGTAKFELTQRDLSFWDVVSQSWDMQNCEYGVYVGKSVLDIQLEGSISM